MKKSKCRYNPAEREQHERAVRLRKMTDAQLCEFTDNLYNEGFEDGCAGKRVIQCGECQFVVCGGVDNSSKCQNKKSPCRGRVVTAEDYCPYGVEREAAASGF